MPPAQGLDCPLAFPEEFPWELCACLLMDLSGLRDVYLMLNPETDPEIQRYQDMDLPLECLSAVESEALGQILALP